MQYIGKIFYLAVVAASNQISTKPCRITLRHEKPSPGASPKIVFHHHQLAIPMKVENQG